MRKKKLIEKSSLVRIEDVYINKVKKHKRKTKSTTSIGKYFGLAAEEKIHNDSLD